MTNTVNIKNETIKDSLHYIKRKNSTSFYFNKNGSRYYYKELSNTTILENEIIAYIIAKNIGVKTVQPHPCTYIDENNNTHTGLISKDYVKDRATTDIITLTTMLDDYHTIDYPSVEKIMSAISYFKYKHQQQNKNLHINDNMEKDLLKMALFMYITGQQDGNIDNIEFIYEDNGNNNYTLSLAPLFDNSVCFYNTLHNDDTTAPKSLKNIKQLKYFMMLKDSPYNMYSLDRIVAELSLAIVDNNELKNTFEKIYNLDINKQISAYLNDNKNVTMQKAYIDKATSYFNTSKNVLTEMLERLDCNYIKGLNDKTNNSGIELQR